MSTIFDIRNIRLPKLSRTSVILGALVIVLALVVGYVGWRLYEKLTNNTVVAYFPAANAPTRVTRSRSWACGWARSTRSSRPATR